MKSAILPVTHSKLREGLALAIRGSGVFTSVSELLSNYVLSEVMLKDEPMEQYLTLQMRPASECPTIVRRDPGERKPVPAPLPRS
jgi:hypothetical protein